MIKCPKCKKKELNDYDDEIAELVCWECGTSFGLEEIGWYEEGGDELLNISNPYFNNQKASTPKGRLNSDRQGKVKW